MVQIDYDPARIDYADLLAYFVAWHDPTSAWYMPQYASLVLYHDDAQRAEAEEALRQAQERLGQPVRTEVRPLGAFYLAEEYHQKYYLRGAQVLWQEVATVLPTGAALVGSTAATRLNAYIAGHGSPEQLEDELPELGLSTAGQQALRALHRQRRR